MNPDSSDKCVVCGKKQRLIFIYKGFDYLKCRNCELVSTYPIPTDKEIENHYLMGFKKGNYKFLRQFSGEYGKVYLQLANILENETEGSLSSKKILDVGCFTGDFLKILQKKGADVYGIELQSDAVKIANKKLPGRVLRADLNNYRLGGEKFDIITLIGIIEHVKDPLGLLRQCNKLLNKNGRIMIQTPDSSSLFAKSMKKFWPPYSPVEHIHLFGRRSLGYALNLSNFDRGIYRNHWKTLPLGYVYNMFNVFGPEFHKFLSPADKFLKRLKIRFPFYIGEMIVIATKKPN